MTHTLRLYKKQRLCSPTAIEALFAHNADCSGALAYPLRAVWRSDDLRRSDSPLAFVIIVPKRRLHHAVDRVLMRRRIREAFRLNHTSYTMPEKSRTDIAFIYVGARTEPYSSVERAMHRLLAKISHAEETKQKPAQS